MSKQIWNELKGLSEKYKNSISDDILNDNENELNQVEEEDNKSKENENSTQKDEEKVGNAPLPEKYNIKFYFI